MPSLAQRTFCEWLGTAFLLAAVVGLMTLAQAYLYPFTQMVPIPRGP